jgi:hypothetical protein
MNKTTPKSKQHNKIQHKFTMPSSIHIGPAVWAVLLGVREKEMMKLI